MTSLVVKKALYNIITGNDVTGVVKNDVTGVVKKDLIQYNNWIYCRCHIAPGQLAVLLASCCMSLDFALGVIFQNRSGVIVDIM